MQQQLQRKTSPGADPMQKKTTTWDPASKKMKTTTSDPDPVVARPEFVESKRPTTTGFEKGDDIIGEVSRESNFHDIWRATSASERDGALDRALSGTGLSADAAKELKKSTGAFLLGGGTPTVDGTKTTAGWAVAEVCKRVADAGADAIADPDKKKHAAAMKALGDHCGDKKFAAWLQSRERVGQRTNVEIAQLGEGKPLPQTPYSPAQYTGVANIYLQAALAAHRWPFVSTHRYEDRDIPGMTIRAASTSRVSTKSSPKKMSHPAGTIYGLEPKHGGASDQSANVSWTKAMCHTDPPA